MHSRWRKGRFNQIDEEPLGPLANLLDLVLVFACGLIAALISMSDQIESHFQSAKKQIVEKGRELPQMPDAESLGGEGYEAVGQVYRDPKSGKLILLGQ